MSIKKVGGLTFVRVWRLSFSYCLCKGPAKAAKRREVASPRLASRMVDGRRVLILA